MAQQPPRSPDGRYWWDGNRWVPVDQPPLAYPPAPGAYQQAAYVPPTASIAQPRSSRKGLLIGCVVALVVLGVCGGGAVIAASRLNQAAQGVVNGPVGQRAEAARYVAAVAQDVGPIANDETGIATACDPGGARTGCRQALVSLTAHIDQARGHLAGLAVPSCLKQVDADYRQGLTHQRQSAEAGIAAIDSNNDSQLAAALQQLGSGAGVYGRMSADLSTAQTTCATGS